MGGGERLHSLEGGEICGRGILKDSLEEDRFEGGKKQSAFSNICWKWNHKAIIAQRERMRNKRLSHWSCFSLVAELMLCV